MNFLKIPTYLIIFYDENMNLLEITFYGQECKYLTASRYQLAHSQSGKPDFVLN